MPALTITNASHGTYAISQIKEALAVRAAAFAYPRQGEGWPCSEIEEMAAQILSGRNELGQTPDEEAAIEAEVLAEARAASERRARAQEERNELVARAVRGLSNTMADVRVAAIRLPGVTTKELAAHGIEYRACINAKIKRLVKIDGGGRIRAR